MKKYYNEHKDQLTLLDWPRCFGDIMPVEPLWMEMLTELTENEIKVFTEESLWEHIFKAWQKVCTQDFVQRVTNIEGPLKQLLVKRGEYVD